MTAASDPATDARTVLDAAEIARALDPHRPRDPRAQQGRRRPRPPRASRPAGVPLAPRLAERIARDRGPRRSRSASLDVTMYRDDLRRAARPRRSSRTEMPAGRHRRQGRRPRRRRALLRPHDPRRARRAAATSAGPRAVQLAVLVDRGHRELPIRADYVGKNLPDRARASGCSVRARRDRRRATRCRDREDGGARDAAPALRRRPRPRRAPCASSTPPSEMAAHASSREIKKLPTLRGRTVVNLFFEDSTRTRISFEAAAKRLSADVINFSRQGLERLQGRVAQGHRADPGGDGRRRRRRPAPRLRCAAPPRHARLDPTARWSTPATAPTSTRRRRCSTPSRCAATSAAAARADLDGRRVAIVGDVLHSRVARSNVLLLRTLGARGHARRAADAAAGRRRGAGRCDVATTSTRRSPRTPDAVMMLRVQRERMNARVLPERARVLPPLRPRRRARMRAAARRTRSSCTPAR